MRVKKLATTVLVVAALVMATLATVTTTTTRPAMAANGPGTNWAIDGYAPNEQTDNIILKWDERLLETIRSGVLPRFTGPTVTARALGILHTATYDAWAAYDSEAVDTRLRLKNDPSLRRPAAEGTGEAGLANKSKAISFAAYTVLVDLFPGRQSAFADYMKSLYGDNFASDTTAPATVGVTAAQAVLAHRHTDNSNQQLSTDPAGNPVVIYPNNTSYSSLNTWNKTPFPWRWQPLCVLTAQGILNGAPHIPASNADSACGPPNYATQSPLTPQWGRIKSFALNENTHYPPQFQLPGPPKLSNGTCCDPSDVDKALSQTSNLTDTQKAKAEYWSDGPGSEFPPGHLAVFAQALSRMRNNSLDQDVKLFFALGNALMDSSISSWHAKYQYDFVRPTTAIRVRYKDKLVASWLGPGNGYGKVLGQNWRPYQQPTVLTPAFPEYVSGHSTFSGAGGVVIALAFGNNGAFNAKVTIPAGSSKIEPNITPANTVVLSWKTLDTASDEAGWSRRWGGIHFETGDLHGRGLGKTIGYNVWKKAQDYFSGDATATT
jgi:hypothetical protein